MRDTEALAQALEQLIGESYYSEDFELLSRLRAFHDALPAPERERLGEVALQRLLDQGSMVDIMLCGVVSVPAAVPELIRRLNAEPRTSQMTRVLMTSLQVYREPAAYGAMERFLDSDQEQETLLALARMDFVRTLPHLLRLLRKDAYLDPCLHILHERRKEVGLEGLLHELRLCVASGPGWLRERFRLVLRAKKEPYNPFEEADLVRLERALAE
jgi:hypothetical protein